MRILPLVTTKKVQSRIQLSRLSLRWRTKPWESTEGRSENWLSTEKEYVLNLITELQILEIKKTILTNFRSNQEKNQVWSWLEVQIKRPYMAANMRAKTTFWNCFHHACWHQNVVVSLPTYMFKHFAMTPYWCAIYWRQHFLAFPLHTGFCTLHDLFSNQHKKDPVDI